jgi:hypothetical protein
MTAEIKRIGKWTALAALEGAAEITKDGDSLVVITVSEEDQTMRFWVANCTNMKLNWMLDNVKTDLFFGINQE